MTVQEYLNRKESLKFCVMFCPDAELRSVYINIFSQAHKGKVTYRETLDFGKQPRQIGAPPVYVLLDWEPGIKKPSAKYKQNKFPVLLMYTTNKEPSQAVKDAYGDAVVVIPPITGAQVTTKLSRSGLSAEIIDYIKAKTDTAQAAILIGTQIVDLAHDLNMSNEDCFARYYQPWLSSQNIDEEPTEFLNALLTKDYQTVFSYISTQRGNELFVFASILNWLEDLIKYCACTGTNYWEEAGLVAARYKPFQAARVKRIPFVQLVHLYEYGLYALQSIKLNESDPTSALEVFVCRIIQRLHLTA